MRLFFAITVPDAVIAHAVVQRDRVRAIVGDEGMRWTDPGTWHFTSKYLGELDESLVTALGETARAVSARHPRFDCTVAGLGAFHTHGRPHVLWLGADVGREAMIALAGSLDEAVAVHGVVRDDHAHHPHLTLARVPQASAQKRVARMLEAATVAAEGASPSFGIDELVLMHSVRSGEARYDVLARFPLK